MYLITLYWIISIRLIYSLPRIPKERPHIQLGDGFCIQFVPFYLSYVGTGRPAKILCMTEHEQMMLCYFCHKGTFEDKLNVGAGRQFHSIDICLRCFEKGACAFIIYVGNSGFSWVVAFLDSDKRCIVCQKKTKKTREIILFVFIFHIVF